MPKLSKKLHLSTDENISLEKIANSRTSPHNWVLRAKILINVDKMTIVELANSFKISTRLIYRLKKKYFSYRQYNATVSKSLEITYLLNDLPRSGRSVTINHQERAVICKDLCQKPKDLGLVGDQWTYRRYCELERDSGVESTNRLSPSYISKLCKRLNLVPHKIKSYLTSKDPDFKEKLDQIANIFKSISDKTEKDVVTISVDEKTAIQALKNIREDIAPMTKGNSSRLRDPEYERLGTSQLIAGVNLNNGDIYGKIFSRNRSIEFVEFLKYLNKLIDPQKQIRIIVDNYGTHLSRVTLNAIELLNNHLKIDYINHKIVVSKFYKQQRFIVVYLPTHSSWLNPIEGVFSRLVRGYLKNLRVNSLDELNRTIIAAIDDLNMHPKPLKWDRFLDNYFRRHPVITAPIQ